MDFDHSEETKLLVDTVKKFAEKEIKPIACEIDVKAAIPQDILQKTSEMGLFGIPFPEEFGGSGLDYSSFIAAIEEIAAADASVALTILAHTLCTNHIFLFGNKEQKNKFLPPLIKGEEIGAWALTEPSSGSDAGSMKTTAKKSGSNWNLNGQKLFTTNGSRANTFVILAKTDESKGTKGVSAFIVEKDTEGLKIGKKLNKLGLRGSDTVEVFIDNLKLPEENLIGKVNKGFNQTMEILDAGRIGISALAIGIARASLQASLKYAKERKQFGKLIKEFQATQWKLSDMAAKIDAARLLAQRAAYLKTKGEKFTKEASMAKLISSETAVMCANNAVQIHGGYGYITEYNVERYFRDAKICEIGEGTSEIQRIVIARELLK
ncbi:MAG: acyl-CoA dehydrogenase family protein [Nitrospinota bacterium]|nr:acyl-CoA dehydrogenase family protein [Nitrospinota bacterium]MDP7580759.1 acyl-CoA dehydrogenase family protein [Nitrospinota bacterium]